MRKQGCKFGGVPEDYVAIHEWFDQTKMIIPDNRHRAILHTSFGVYLAQQVFGATFVNSDGRTVNTRDVAEQHCLEDYGGKYIPTLQDFLQEMNYQPWMHGHGYPASAQKVIDARMEGTKKALAD